ncbi:MAG: tetratricopeptide repeat protein [Defluviicoccus sp.]|nr:tetratricopeptide repeat protein [Defluviicoccus sp.]
MDDDEGNMRPATDDDPMRRVMAWIAAAASLSFATVGLANQNDPRLGPLFERLKAAPSAEAAAPEEQAIWRIWHESGSAEIDALMVRGLRAMGTRDLRAALAAFDEMVRRAPEFAEAWNKRATVNYLIGRLPESIADIDRTLALEPRHFGALSGLGLVRLAEGEDEKALDAFDRALAVHPNLAGADTHIRALREKLRGRRI